MGGDCNPHSTPRLSRCHERYVRGANSDHGNANTGPQKLTGGDDVDPSPVAVEFHLAVDQRKQRVILALPYAASGMPFVTDLPRQDISRDDFLAAEFLDSATLGVGIATGAAGALSLFMFHEIVSG